MNDFPNLEVYADPDEYDQESGAYDPEGSILLSLANQGPGPVLELGCGTGRVTIPLALQGLEMTGLDVLPRMLDRAKQKSEGLPIRWVCQDVRDFQLDGQYSLIFTYGVILQHLLTRADQEAMLSQVGQHLAPGGRFVVDANLKLPAKMVDAEEPALWYSFNDEQGRQVEVWGTDHYDYVGQIWTQTLTRRWQSGGQEQRGEPVAITVRYFMPQELQSLLHYNGFVILERYGSWQGEPLSDKSDMQIYVCGRQ